VKGKKIKIKETSSLLNSAYILRKLLYSVLAQEMENISIKFPLFFIFFSSYVVSNITVINLIFLTMGDINSRNQNYRVLLLIMFNGTCSYAQCFCYYLCFLFLVQIDTQI
jgi:hypothetical protein